MNEIIQIDYDKLVEECKSIKTESEFNSRWSLVEGYWLLGQRIRKDVVAKEDEKGNKELLTKLSEDINLSLRTIYYTLQFFDKYSSLDLLPVGKNVSWKMVKTKLLCTPVHGTEPPRIEGPGEIAILQGDFRRQTFEPDSIDLILTDPPYPAEYLPLWNDLAIQALSVLKPGGFLIAYSGQKHLPEVINALSPLTYYWLGMLYHEGQAGQRFEVNMFNRAKPILFYYKPPLTKQEPWIDDVLRSPMPDKEHHEWGQNIEPLKKLIETFSKPGDTIYDPFAGGGATLEAAKQLGRNSIGVEINSETYNYLDKRL